MNAAPESRPVVAPLTGFKAGFLAVIGVACFHLAYTPAQSGVLAFAIVGYLICLVQLARLRTTRQCFYTALATGLACVAPQLECFWRIFGAFAIALWLILAVWIALFVVLSHIALVKLGAKRAALLIPFLWTGLEYFRSELYYLKFSWLNVGYAFAGSSVIPWEYLGVYGVGFVIAAWSGLFFPFPARRVLTYTFGTVATFLVAFFLLLPTAKTRLPIPNLRVAGLPRPNPCHGSGCGR